MPVNVRIIFILAFLSLSGKNGFGQICFPVKKIHAFFEPVKKGVISKDDVKTRQSSGNYLVYIESTKSNIRLKNIWINGTIYNGELKEVSTPVVSVLAGENGPLNTAKPPLEMVPATKRKVYQVVFTALQPGQEKAVIPARYAARPLLIQLQYKKKTRSFPVDEIREARPATMM